MAGLLESWRSVDVGNKKRRVWLLASLCHLCFFGGSGIEEFSEWSSHLNACFCPFCIAGSFCL